MTKIAVVLSGCGVFDGAEVYESVLTLLALSKRNIEYQCMAPDINQMHVINHLTEEPMDETRNVLIEAARIARGEIIDLAKANANDYDAAIFPGGFGAAKNLCDFAIQGENTSVQPAVAEFVDAMRTQHKPTAFLCIAPAMIPKLYPQGTQLTIGNDTTVAANIEAMGGKHVDCDVQSIVIDKTNRVITTPAYMLAQSIQEAAIGIEKTVEALLDMI